LLPLAALGEIIGYRRIYIWGLVLFTASLLCAVAWSPAHAGDGAFLQGLGGAGIMSVNTALIRFIYPTARAWRGPEYAHRGHRLHRRALGGLGHPRHCALAVAVCGQRAAVAAVILALPSLPHTALSSHAFDLRRAVLNAAAFGLLILAIGEGAHQAEAQVVGWNWALSADCSCSSANCRTRHRCCRWTCSAIPCSRSRPSPPCVPSRQGLAFVSLPFFFHHDLGRSQVEIGLLMTPWPVAVAIMAPIAGRLSDRYPVGILGGVGLALLCAGCCR
jgi:DHA2 family multidrug resistance protein-like MFS transporter